jgi:hypothetical protein
MVVIVLILLSLGVAMFIMLSDTRRNDNFKRLDQGGDAPAVADAGGSDAGTCDAGGGDGGGGCD